jgi:hypothetical protein
VTDGHKTLKLRAEDDEDLAVLAAFLTGAIGRLGEMAYDPEARRFAAILVRPLWEEAEPDEADHTGTIGRIRAGLHFDHVGAVRYRNLHRDAPETLLHLVSIAAAPIAERYGVILSFRGGGEVLLEVDRLNGLLQDLDTERQKQS